MNALSYIIWNFDPDIFSKGFITLRWYGLMFALGFLLSQQILYYIFKKEGKPSKDVDTLTIYMVIATVIGARLGHVLFYEPERYLSDPIKILKIWEGGLASHGAAAGILVALWLYARKNKPGQGYFQILDRIVILVALTGAFIRIGNFFNSEIVGIPTHSRQGVLFTRHITEAIEAASPEVKIESVDYIPVDSAANEQGYYPLKILITYAKGDYTRPVIERDLQDILGTINYWVQRDYMHENIYTGYFKYGFALDENGQFGAIIRTYAIPRHPAQLYESASCIVLFVLLFWLWYKQKENLPPGRLLGIFLIVCFTLRFLYEFLKENQVNFENHLPLNMGQILSIPLVIAGIVILILSYRKPGHA